VLAALYSPGKLLLLEALNTDILKSLETVNGFVRFEVFTVMTLQETVYFWLEPTFQKNVSPPSSGQVNRNENI
jgi:hypothetical protein